MNRKKKYCNRCRYGMLFLMVFLLSLVQFSCKDEFDKYYEYPDDLAGPIYQQLAADTTFTEFVKAIDKLPEFRKAINTSGLYTAFVPTNAAVKKYLRENYPGKNSFDEFNMSLDTDSIFVQSFVDAHFVYDMYFEYNFNKIISDDPNVYGDKFRHFVRYHEPVYEYFDKSVNRIRKVKPNNKLAPIFTSKYLNKYKMSADYTALYGRSPGDFNIEDAQVLSEKRDIAAINGVIHAIDRVLKPRKNLLSVVEESNPMFYQMQEFNTYLGFDESATISEGGSGEKLDSIFMRSSYFGWNYTYENNMYTFFNPPREAYENYIKTEILPHTNSSIDSIHFLTRMYLTDSYVNSYAAWSSDLAQGVPTSFGDTIINPQYDEVTTASNGIVYNLKELLLPSALTSVARGFMIKSNYSWFFDLVTNLMVSKTVSGKYTSYTWNINYLNIVYLQNKQKKFTIFVPCNKALGNVEGYDITRELVYNGAFKAYNYRRQGRVMPNRQRDSLVNYMIIPDVVIKPSEVQSLNKWFETRLGCYIQIADGKLNGGALLELGVDDYEETENGIIYYLNSEYMPMKPNATVTDILKKDFPKFYQIIKARYVEEEDEISDDVKLEAFLKLSTEMFTVFAPTDDALDAYKDDYNAAHPGSELGAYDSDKRWGQIAKYLITKTRVYSDGTFKQDEAAMNPDPDDNSKYVSVFKDVVYVDPAGQDVYSYFRVTFSPGEMRVSNQAGVSTPVIPILYNGRNVMDIEASNGVIHPIGEVLTPPDQIIHN